MRTSGRAVSAPHAGQKPENPRENAALGPSVEALIDNLPVGLVGALDAALAWLELAQMMWILRTVIRIMYIMEPTLGTQPSRRSGKRVLRR